MNLIRLADALQAPLSIFSHASSSAARVSRLTWFLIILASVVYVIVIALMLRATRRNRAAAPDGVMLDDPGTKWIAIGGMILPALVLVAVFLASETALGATHTGSPALTLRITGHQWWWNVEYEFPDPRTRFRTANEIHIPVGRQVRLLLTSADVIHSFWVPQLQGKIDLIPGDTNDLRLDVTDAGTYRGTCAEFCGTQYAHMGIVVVAEDSASFTAWVQGQLANSAPPGDDVSAAGQRLFVAGPCALCHTVRGTPAGGAVAPDLTHVGSRLTIAAGTLPNTLGNLEAWITNAPSLKPGTQMPAITQYSGEQLRALAEYVGSLK